MPLNEVNPESLALASQIIEMVNSSWMSQAISVMARLGIADLLATGPKSSAELAAATSTHPPSLHRLLRSLVTLEIVHEGEDSLFELTALGSVLCRDSAVSVRSWAVYWGGCHWPVWGHLLESIQSGQSARTLLAGTEGFEHLERDPEMAAVFNQAMVELTHLIAGRVVRAYDFSGMECIVDVGGGYGELLAAILTANPAAHGLLFDRPHAAQSGQRHLEALGLAGRCEFVAGSFFEVLPHGADAYVLKNILHDWNDERCGVILAVCRQAVPGKSKLLLVEQVMPERLEASPSHRSVVRGDLNMMVGLGAQERTEAEFRSLLTAAGFRLTRIIPATPTLNIIEAAAV